MRSCSACDFYYLKELKRGRGEVGDTEKLQLIIMSSKIELHSPDELKQLERAFYTVCQNFFKEGDGVDFSAQQTAIVKDQFTQMLRQIFGQARDNVVVKDAVSTEAVDATLQSSVEALRAETKAALEKLQKNRDSLAEALEKQEKSLQETEGDKTSAEDKTDSSEDKANLGCSPEDIETIAGIQMAIEKQLQHLGDVLPKHLQSCRNLFTYLKGKQGAATSNADAIVKEGSDSYGKAVKSGSGGENRAKPY